MIEYSDFEISIRSDLSVKSSYIDGSSALGMLKIDQNGMQEALKEIRDDKIPVSRQYIKQSMNVSKLLKVLIIVSNPSDAFHHSP